MLCLDELGEFPPHLLDALRQPMEEGEVVVARKGASVTFLTRSRLIAASNPCPCGYAGDRLVSCRCTPPDTSTATSAGCPAPCWTGSRRVGLGSMDDETWVEELRQRSYDFHLGTAIDMRYRIERISEHRVVPETIRTRYLQALFGLWCEVEILEERGESAEGIPPEIEADMRRVDYADGRFFLNE